jgi:membrane protein DedA with SNARE-associated domain
MKPFRFIIALAALLLVWFVVTVGVGYLIGMVFEPKSESHFLGIWMDWHALPGLVLGLIMGLRAFRAIASSSRGATRNL